MATADVTLMTAPPGPMEPAHARVTRYIAVRFVSRTACHCPSSIWSSSRWETIPALLTNTSRPPSRARASSTSASTDAGSVTSQATTCQSPSWSPSSSASDAASELGRRWQTTPRAPRSANRSAIARPIPREPPVTRTRAPVKSSTPSVTLALMPPSPRSRRCAARRDPARRGAWAWSPDGGSARPPSREMPRGSPTRSAARRRRARLPSGAARRARVRVSRRPWRRPSRTPPRTPGGHPDGFEQTPSRVRAWDFSFQVDDEPVDGHRRRRAQRAQRRSERVLLWTALECVEGLGGLPVARDNEDVGLDRIAQQRLAQGSRRPPHFGGNRLPGPLELLLASRQHGEPQRGSNHVRHRPAERRGRVADTSGRARPP